MTKINLYSKTGSKTTALVPVDLVEEISSKLLSQAMRIYQDRQHPGNRKAKTRAEVNITKKKVYRQKGTGNARHGAASAPIFVGGGVAHGPKSIKKILRLPKAMARKATKGALNVKIADQKAVAADIAKLTKTVQAAKLITSIKNDLKITKSNFVLVVLDETNKDSSRAFRNLANTQISTIKNINSYQISRASLVILDSNLVKQTKQK